MQSDIVEDSDLPQLAPGFWGCLLASLFLGFCWGVIIAVAVLVYRVLT